MAKDQRFDKTIINSKKEERVEEKIVGKEIANNSILADHITNGAITTDKLAPGLVSIAVITDNAITTSKIANSSVTPTKLSIDWPVFYAWIAGGQNNTVTGRFGDSGKPVFSATRVNSGYYNTSNGRFTAPTAGIYEFNFALIHRYVSAAGSLEVSFYVNGVNASPRAFSYSWVTGPSDHDWVHTHAILSLNAGQYVQCGIHACSAGTDYYYGENLGYFSGKQIR